MSTPTPGAVSLLDLHASPRTAPALIADDGALWVCVRCASVCSCEHGALYACRRCGAEYALHEAHPTGRPTTQRI